MPFKIHHFPPTKEVYVVEDTELNIGVAECLSEKEAMEYIAKREFKTVWNLKQ